MVQNTNIMQIAKKGIFLSTFLCTLNFQSNTSAAYVFIDNATEKSTLTISATNSSNDDSDSNTMSSSVDSSGNVFLLF